jgi:hypothetical protein
MTKEQAIHVSMINSLNVVLNRATVSDVVDSGVGIFAHSPDDVIDYNTLNDMILYFESKQMFENCALLLAHQNSNFNEDGSIKYKLCMCPQPIIGAYTNPLNCQSCRCRIQR